MNPFLITGCGRSGTMWAAKFFSALGFECGHEVSFSHSSSGPLVLPESSWLAVPHLSKLPKNTPVLRLVRDPFRVIQSVMNRGFLSWRKSVQWEEYVKRHRPDIVEPEDQLTRAILWATTWDDPVDEVEHLTLKIEDDRLASYCDAVCYATRQTPDPSEVLEALETLGRKINAGNGMEWPSRKEIALHCEGGRVIQRAEKFGYKI